MLCNYLVCFFVFFKIFTNDKKCDKILGIFLESKFEESVDIFPFFSSFLTRYDFAFNFLLARF